MMKVNVSVFCSCVFSRCRAFSGWTSSPLTSGGRKLLHDSLFQCLEKGGCPWTERWDLALLLLCQSYAEPNQRASEKKLLYLYEDSLWD